MNDEPNHKHRKYFILALFAVFIAILGVILPETEFTPKQYIFASNITVVGATITSGSVINLTDINNGYVNITETTSPYYVDINFTNITNFSFPELKARYFSTTGTPSTHIVDLEIWCEMDQAYDDLKDLTNHADWQYFTRHIPDYSHFIRPDGNVTIRLNHTANGNVNHRLYIDTARLITSVQYEQNNIVLNQYFNTTTGGGGGVSFDGSIVDLNGSILKNGTFNGTFNGSISKDFDFYEFGLTNFSFIKNISSPYSDVYLYVNKSGNDNNDCSTNLPCLTIQNTINKIPAILNTNYHVNISDGVYQEIIKIGGKAYSGSYSIYINGTVRNITTAVTSVGSPGSYSSQASMNLNITMTPEQYTGKYIQFQNTTLAGTKRIINFHNSTWITLTGDALSAAPTNTLLSIYENNVTITRFTLEPNQVNIIFHNININNQGNSSQLLASSLIQAQAQFFEVNFTDGVDMSLSDFYCFMCVSNNTVDFSGFQVRNSVFEYQSSLLYSSCGACSYNYSWGVIVKPGSYALLTSGTTLRNFSYALYVSNSGTAQTWGKTLSYPFFQNNRVTAFYAFGGGMISTTSGQRVFSNNAVDKTCDAASFSWCDT